MSKQVRLTLPDDLYQHLKEQAGKDDRTIANYILHLLKNPPKVQSPIYFPPGVRSPLPQEFIPHNTPGGIRTPENPDRETNHNLHKYKHKWAEK